MADSLGGGSMNQNLKKGISARECLPSPHVNVGIRYIRISTANLYIQFHWMIKDRPVNFGQLRTIF